MNWQQTDSSNILVLENVGCELGGAVILEDVSLAVAQGDYLALAGPNGAGKTTLLRAICGIIQTTGTISVKGKSVQAYKPRALARIVGYVPQHFLQAPYTAETFVSMGRYCHHQAFGFSTREDRIAVEEAMEATDCLAFRDRPVNTLSGGEKKKVAIAAALAQQPRLLLLDEPSAFLDPRHAVEIQKLLHHINEEMGVTIVLVTHEIATLSMQARNVAAIKQGSLIYHGAVDEFVSGDMPEKLYDTPFRTVPHPVSGLPVLLQEHS